MVAPLKTTPTYSVYFRRNPSNRVQSTVSPQDYKLVGTVRAMTCSEAFRKWFTKDYVRCLGGHRTLVVGDMLGIYDDYWVYTPNGQWASVKVVDPNPLV